MKATASQADDTPIRWELTPHCCRVCFGRVLGRVTFDRGKIFKCSCCGSEVEGQAPSVLCSCGIKLRGGRDAGVRCAINTHRTPENPAEIVAEQVDVSNIVAR